MNGAEQNQSTVSVRSSSSLHSLDVSTRFQGMIELSPYKKTRNSLFQLFDYVSATSPPFFGLHMFISIWRLIQFFGPALVSNYDTFWGKDTVMFKVLDIASIIFYIIPVSQRGEIAYIILFIYSALFTGFYIFLGVFSSYLSRNAKLPKSVPIIISLFLGTFGYIFQPVVCELASELVGKMIANPDKYVNVLNILSLVISFLVFVVFCWLYGSIYIVSITFKPDSLMTVIPDVQAQTTMLFLVITYCIGVGSQLSNIPKLILTILALVLYLFVSPLSTMKGGLVQEAYLKANIAISFSGAIILAIVVIFQLANIVAAEFMIIVIILVFLISFLCTHFFYRHQIQKKAKILDFIEDDNTNIDLVKNQRQLCDLIVVGFRLAHPICITFQLLKLGIEKYPKCVDLWVLYAKFIAIFPEETQQLSYVAVGMNQNKIKGSLSKHTQQQIKSIMRQRETNLVPELKAKIDKVGKQVQATKHKVRYIWDLIIQGNIKELESVVDRAYTSIDASEADFLHLLHQFPNSRFVARAYARFLRDVVADHAGHKTWASNVSMLQRGASVAPDQAHDLGVRAFQLLPTFLDSKLNGNNTTAQGVLTDDTLTQEIDADDEQAAIDAELRMSVRESINKLKIPSYRQARVLRVLMLFIFFIIPTIALAIYVPIFISELSEPLVFMYAISSIRCKTFQALGSGMHHIFESLNAVNPLSNTVTFPFENNSQIDIDEPAPVSFGGFYDSKKQCEFLSNELSNTLPNLQLLMSYKDRDDSMNEAREDIFGNTIHFIQISEPQRQTGWTPTTTDERLTKYSFSFSWKSTMAVIMQFIISFNKLSQMESLPFDTINQPYVTIPLNNMASLTANLESALLKINAFIRKSEKDVRKMILIALITIVILSPALYICSCIYIILRVSKEKMLIYKCLASLPKNIVSRVADSFKVLKKEEDDEVKTNKTHDEELNKQEENMLKIFATSSDSSHGKATDIIIIVVSTIIVFALNVGLTSLVCTFLQESASKFKDSAPHVDFITAAYSYDLASKMLLKMLPATLHPYPIYHFVNYNVSAIIYILSQWQQKGVLQYRAVKFGNKSIGAVPFTSLGANINFGSKSECLAVKKPESIHDCYKCWSPDILLSHSQMKVNSYIQEFLTTRVPFAGNDPYLKHMWHIHQVHIFDQYFSEMFEQIIPMVNRILNQRVPMVIGVSFFFMFVAIFVDAFLLRMLQISENRQKFALRLLLHCPGNVVVSNSHITALLSGNFAEKQLDSTTRDAEFYDVIVKEMPDSILILDLEGKIITANNATKRIYGRELDTLVGRSITFLDEFFKNEKIFTEVFSKTEKVPFEKNAVYLKGPESEIHIELAFTVLGDNYVVTTRDITQTVMYNRLISDEKAKSDHLLSSILPAKLVPRVQAGEKNISFAVQSVTILFMDIVSFTPWCGSLPAATVMRTLNLLFKDMDALCSVHPTMTKIKCIGDCYMAAGGIFAEVNQPAVHAKDVVEFGLDAIDALEKLNSRIDQDLKIRVGVNTGGPIVAGVIGTEKPTFEILGPTINMAQQMEHHGIPMKVHISRAVYELIYGGTFDVKERGEIEIKNGNVVTYIINKRSAPIKAV